MKKLIKKIKEIFLKIKIFFKPEEVVEEKEPEVQEPEHIEVSGHQNVWSKQTLENICSNIEEAVHNMSEGV